MFTYLKKITFYVEEAKEQCISKKKKLFRPLVNSTETRPLFLLQIYEQNKYENAKFKD